MITKLVIVCKNDDISDFSKAQVEEHHDRNLRILWRHIQEEFRGVFKVETNLED